MKSITWAVSGLARFRARLPTRPIPSKNYSGPRGAAQVMRQQKPFQTIRPPHSAEGTKRWLARAPQESFQSCRRKSSPSGSPLSGPLDLAEA